MLKQIREYFSLKQRRLRRKAEQERGTVTEEKIKKLLRKIEPHMYIDIKKLEKELIEKGKVIMDMHDFSLDDNNKIFKKISAIEIEAQNLDLGDLTLVRIRTNNEGQRRIIQVSASTNYMKRIVGPLLVERGIEMVCINAGPEWYSMKFTIEGL